MSESKEKIKLFGEKQVRAVWDEEAEKWWFSIVDVVSVLTDSADAQAYWRKLKQRLKEEGNETVTNCHGLKMLSPDGKMRLTDVADTEQILRLIQSIPSKRAEPFKLWLAKVGNERIDETVDPEQSIDRAIQNYRRLGYSESWINQRIKLIEVRKALTDEWDKSGVKQGTEYSALTDLMSKTWSGMTTREYKKYKGLKKENLRDNMTNTELVLNMLAEVAATDISIVRQPSGFDESAEVAQEGAKAAKVARKQIEKSTGRPAVSKLSANNSGKRLLEEN
ncbi:MAG: Bro-N domain-containing protein [Spirochaetes bacterium]|nr:Bro-N domain-containing protein [Spirochaetota bacterium]